MCRLTWGWDGRRAGYPQQEAFSMLLPDDFDTSSIVNCSAIVGCTPTVSSRSCRDKSTGVNADDAVRVVGIAEWFSGKEVLEEWMTYFISYALSKGEWKALDDFPCIRWCDVHSDDPVTVFSINDNFDVAKRAYVLVFMRQAPLQGFELSCIWVHCICPIDRYGFFLCKTYCSKLKWSEDSGRYVLQIKFIFYQISYEMTAN